MKRKHADRSDWKRIESREFAIMYQETEDFSGYVTLLHFHAVRAPLIKKMDGRKLVLADAGYYWMQHFPQGKRYSVTTMLNDKEEVVQWYVDVCEPPVLDERGIPYYDDLYLDVVLLPSGKSFLLDEEELDEALGLGRISEEQYRLASEEAHHLMEHITELAAVRNGMDDFRQLKLLLRPYPNG
ncbi:DUF402 domain-containing protein [Paenibacillus thiaminolyticus]|uniref:DUF402 domain-containing protein n=1 Tax=Paenibacillus thiaminolyticus TaxID=49283 RepID=UPI0035A60574